MSKKVMTLVAKAALKTAQSATNSASFFGFHQPKEPKDIQSRLDAMKKIK